MFSEINVDMNEPGKTQQAAVVYLQREGLALKFERKDMSQEPRL